MLELISHSELETMKFAKEIASKLEKGDVIVLTGDLGAGKTKFTQGILSYFNLEEEISSPTFTIVNEYKNNDVNIYHFDVYRLEGVDEFLAIGGEEYFEKGISIIEWGEIISEILPKNAIKINILKDENNIDNRVIKIENFER